jgi:starch phosphorylase
MAISTDLETRIEELEARLVPSLRPLARVAYDYRWSWHPDGAAVFRELDAERWRHVKENPVALLAGLRRARQLAVVAGGECACRVERLANALALEREREPEPAPGLDGPVAFLCAEFGVHVSLSIYSGGLGVLAGDFLKEASDRRLPFVGIGLLYRRGYFLQRLDLTGWQQEHWLEYDPDELPLSLVLGRDGTPLRLEVSVFDRPLGFRVWCAQIGRVPLLLLDADVPENDAVQRWTTARLYDGNPEIRLAQYGLLGIGGARVLAALGIEPSVVHLNEGHPALAALELAAENGDAPLDDLRRRVAFTTHTPLPAGNETYQRDVFVRAFGDLGGRLGLDGDGFVALAGAGEERAGLSQLAMRVAGRRNAVSRAHEATSRTIWRSLFPGGEPPIDHVTNGAHIATFVCASLADLFTEHLGKDWRRNPASPEVWEGVRTIPNAELWAARNKARAQLVAYARERVTTHRLLRGEPLEIADAAVDGMDPDALTLGFARRVALYKRLHLLFADVERGSRILADARRIQLLVAGKAHPRDDEAKALLQRLYRLRDQVPGSSGRVVFLEDYDLAVARELVGGCDVWVNVPRPPLEASGTSGMKASFNGVLQLSVLDGWWSEGFNGSNGWAIAADTDGDPATADAADADRLYSLLEDEVIPLFYERSADGVPHRWCELVKEAIATCAPAFSATRMLKDYVERIYVPLRSR